MRERKLLCSCEQDQNPDNLIIGELFVGRDTDRFEAGADKSKSLTLLFHTATDNRENEGWMIPALENAGWSKTRWWDEAKAVKVTQA